MNVDVAFQGVVVPAGEGDLRLEYVPRWFGIGALLSGLAVLACSAALGRGLVKRLLGQANGAQLPRG